MNLKKSYKRISIIVISVILVGLILYLFKPTQYEAQINEIVRETSNIIASPNPFDEITIPSLRKKEYKSSLGELDQVSENSSYTSYLTSYTSDGLKINGLLTKPTGEMPEGGFPAIVFVHGYIPPTQYQTLQNYEDYVNYLARNGFVVFKIDLRGHADSEGEAGGGYFGGDYVTDTLNAYSALQNSGFVNPNGIGLWGHSMAGNIVMRSFAVKPEIPGVVIWAGAVYTYVDQREYGINDNSYRPPSTSSVQRSRRQQLYERVGSPSATSEFWQRMAPTTYLNDLKGAIQIHHAVDDAVVDIRYSRNLNMLLNKSSVEHELFEYQSGGHNLTGSSFTQAMQRTVDFYKDYLAP